MKQARAVFQNNQRTDRRRTGFPQRTSINVKVLHSRSKNEITEAGLPHAASAIVGHPDMSGWRKDFGPRRVFMLLSFSNRLANDGL